MKNLMMALSSIALVSSSAVLGADRLFTETATVVVETADLNLATPQGQTQFERRYNNAERRVCPMPDNRDLEQLRQRQRCLAQVRQSTAAQLTAIRSNAQFVNVSPKTPPTAVLAP